MLCVGTNESKRVVMTWNFWRCDRPSHDDELSRRPKWRWRDDTFGSCVGWFVVWHENWKDGDIVQLENWQSSQWYFSKIEKERMVLSMLHQDDGRDAPRPPLQSPCTPIPTRSASPADEYEFSSAWFKKETGDEPSGQQEVDEQINEEAEATTTCKEERSDSLPSLIILHKIAFYPKTFCPEMNTPKRSSY
jgi:hypothetical protein